MKFLSGWFFVYILHDTLCGDIQTLKGEALKIIKIKETKIMTLELRKVNKKVGRKTNRPSVEELAELYAKHTTRELAEHYDVPESTVKGWIFYYRHKAPKVVSE